jgi:Cysteine rich repeat
MKPVLAMAMMLTIGGSCPALLHAEGECKADVQKFCGDVKPGQGRIIDCLKAHAPDLSDSCRTKMKAAKEAIQAKAKAVQDACGEDRQKYCGDVQPGEGRIKDCMTQHSSELSGACQATAGQKKTTGPS